MKYDHKKIEKKWQKKWAAKKIYRTKEQPRKPKTYVLDMFPYPSGEGLHVGHPKGYIATDIYSRMKRMQGHSVLHPMGWDAFGLPAENFAIKHKVHPRKAVEKNVKRFKEQLGKIGLDYDWSREINTTDPAYYKWTQWIFLQLYKKGLAYQSEEPINWCPSCQTGLSNEDLDGGVCERCGSQVEKRPMRQWVLRITDYADRMLTDLSLLPRWPEHIKEAQRNWIGKSEGVLIDFALEGIEGQEDGKHKVRVFTTRPDTLFGATFVSVSPELATIWLRIGWKASREIRTYIEKAMDERAKAGVEGVKVKTGVAAGIWAINPANKEKIPVWVTNYVLGDVGTGAIMAVPAHDERDYEFAKKYNLPIRDVIEPEYIQSTEPGKVRDGEPFDHRDAIIAIVKHWSEDKYMALKWKTVAWGTFVTGGIEKGQTPEEAARMEIREETGYTDLKFVKDMGMVHGLFYHVPKKKNTAAHAHVLYFEMGGDAHEPVSDDEAAKHEVLWLTAGEMQRFLTPDTHRHSLRWLMEEQRAYTGAGVIMGSGSFNGLHSREAREKITTLVSGKATTTYRLKDWVFSRQRYWGEPIPIIHCAECGVVPVPEKDLPVKLPDVKNYAPTGTGESPLAAIDKWVNVKCPRCKGKAKRETNTMPQWAGSSWYYLRFMDPKNKKALVDPKREKYWAPVDVYVGGDHAVRHLIYARFWHKFLYDIGVVSTVEPFTRLEYLGFILAEDGRKMSKRYGNVINPDDVSTTWGADTLRLYEMFMGPFPDTIAWSSENMIGVRRFLERLWRLSDRVQAKDDVAVTPELHRTIKKVSEDVENFKFNTAVSQMMIFLNAVEKAGAIGKAQWAQFLKLLAPFAPHIAEELWAGAKQKGSVHEAQWPKHDPKKLVLSTATIAIQVNGKVRGQISVASGISEEEATKAAVKEVAKWLNGKELVKTIYVPNRLVSIVVKP